MLAPITRVIVISATVGLLTVKSQSDGGPNTLLAAKGEAKPEAIAVRAGNAFAIDLYRMLSRKEGNVFFSPFSISSALTMAAEGARGETALEMGKVLRFPEEVRRVGAADAQRIPWELSGIHSGMAELHRLLTGNDEAGNLALRERIAQLERGHEEISTRLRELRSQPEGGEERRKLQGDERELVRKLNDLLKKVDPCELRVANALWSERSYPLNEAFTGSLDRAYGTGGVFPADFKTAAERERERINAWAAENTRGKIPSILPPGSVSVDTRLVIANAIYFRGDWKTPFRESRTRDEDFFADPGAPVRVPLMFARALRTCRYGAFNADGSRFDTPAEYEQGTEPNGYPAAGGFAAVELPYKGDTLSMVVLAPVDKDGLPALEKSLTAANLSAWIDKLVRRSTHVYLPRFEADTGYRLSDALRELGMKSAFVEPSLPGGADFTGMTVAANREELLFLSEVFHKAFVSVNEKGTEAAAVTAIAAPSSVPPPVPKKMIPFTPTFRADRPFLFLVRDQRTGSILFMGRIRQP